MKRMGGEGLNYYLLFTNDWLAAQLHALFAFDVVQKHDLFRLPAFYTFVVIIYVWNK